LLENLDWEPSFHAAHCGPNACETSNVRDDFHTHEENPMKRIAFVAAIFAVAACSGSDTATQDTTQPALAPAPAPTLGATTGMTTGATTGTTTGATTGTKRP
jgi:hypothetical protein